MAPRKRHQGTTSYGMGLMELTWLWLRGPQNINQGTTLAQSTWGIRQKNWTDSGHVAPRNRNKGTTLVPDTWGTELKELEWLQPHGSAEQKARKYIGYESTTTWLTKHKSRNKTCLRLRGEQDSRNWHDSGGKAPRNNKGTTLAPATYGIDRTKGTDLTPATWPHGTVTFTSVAVAKYRRNWMDLLGNL